MDTLLVGDTVKIINREAGHYFRNIATVRDILSDGRLFVLVTAGTMRGAKVCFLPTEVELYARRANGE